MKMFTNDRVRGACVAIKPESRSTQTLLITMYCDTRRDG